MQSPQQYTNALREWNGASGSEKCHPDANSALAAQLDKQTYETFSALLSKYRLAPQTMVVYLLPATQHWVRYALPAQLAHTLLEKPHKVATADQPAVTE